MSFTQISLKCPQLLCMRVTKNAIKHRLDNGYKIDSEEERIPVQTEALSILDTETGNRKILCTYLNKVNCIKRNKVCEFL